MKVGRNDACPCGSGLKYKKCCLDRESAMRGAYSSGDREDALHRLDRFCGRHEDEAEREVAEDEFFESVDELPDVDTRDQDVLDGGDDTFDDWFALDRVGAEGLTPVERLLRDEGDRLTSGEREFLERFGRTQLRPYEVRRVSRDGLDLVDLLEDEPRAIAVSEGSEDFEPGDIVAARVMTGPSGDPILEGSILVYPASAKEAVLEAARRAPGDAPALHLQWVMHTAPPLEPEACIHVVFDVLDRERLTSILEARDDIEEDEEDEDAYVWLEGVGDDEQVLGAFTLEGDQLVFHAADDALAERARRMIQRAAGDSVSYVDTYPDASEDDEEDDEPRP